MIGINIDGKIKTFGSIPTKWNGIHAYDTLDPEDHFEDGFREVVIPQVTEGKKLGTLQYDAANDVFTYPLIDKSAEELAAEAENVKAQEKEKLFKIKLDKLAEGQLTIAEMVSIYPEWKAGAYGKDERVIYKEKPFNNDVDNNTNAPDKGGWTELK